MFIVKNDRGGYWWGMKDGVAAWTQQLEEAGEFPTYESAYHATAYWCDGPPEIIEIDEPVADQ